MPNTVIERFLSYVDIKSKDECWVWRGPITSSGYGVFNDGITRISAHRHSYEYFIGPLEYDLCLHTCDNRACVNPNHLYRGTYADNTYDMISRDRHNLSINSRFSAKEIKLIRSLRIITSRIGQRNKYRYGPTYLAKIFNTSYSTILKIWNRESYPCREGYYV